MYRQVLLVVALCVVSFFVGRLTGGGPGTGGGPQRAHDGATSGKDTEEGGSAPRLHGRGESTHAQAAPPDSDRFDEILQELLQIKSAVIADPTGSSDESRGTWVRVEFERLEVRRLAFRLLAELRQRRESLADNIKMLEENRDDAGAREVKQQLADLDTQERDVRDASTFAELEEAAKGPYRDLFYLLSQ